MISNDMGDEGYVKNCILSIKEDQKGAMFNFTPNGVIAYLDGYAIIPKEEYEELLKLK